MTSIAKPSIATATLKALCLIGDALQEQLLVTDTVGALIQGEMFKQMCVKDVQACGER